MSKLLSFRTLYILFAVKMLAWSIGLMLGLQFPEHSGSQIPDLPMWLMFGFSVLALANLKWNLYWIYTVATLAFIFSWTYALFELGPQQLSFIRTLPETVLVYWLAAYIQINRKNKNLMGQLVIDNF